jgi:hypothetical protein
MKKILLCLFISTVSGCASVPPMNSSLIQFQPARELVYKPSTNQEAEADIGQSLISKGIVITTPSVTINKSVTEYRKQSMMNNRWSGTTTVHAGELPKVYQDNVGEYFKSPTGSFKFPMGDTDFDVGVFVPFDKNNPSLIYTYHTTSGAQGMEYGSEQVKYTRGEIVEWVDTKFRRELIYGGILNNVITITYREFSDNYARPAFQQELKYDISHESVIGFKGARIQIINATNTRVKYKVLSQID